MLKSLAALLVLTPVAAHAFTKCDLTDIGGPGAKIAEEASNPVISGKWAYAAFAQDTKVLVLVASDNGATQQPLQTIFDQPRPASDVRLAASGKYLYVIWLHGESGGAHLWFAANSNHGAAKSWSAPVDLGPAHISLPQISVDGNNVHIAYVLRNNDTGVLSSSDNGRTFQPSVDIGTGDGEVVVASSGQDVYAAWEVGKTSQIPSIDFAVSHNGGGTFSVKTINGARHAHEPIFSLNQSSGRLSLVWREDSPQTGTYLQSNDHGETWSAPLTIDGSSRQFMVQDAGSKIYVSYLKDIRTSGSEQDWQVQLATSSDGGLSFPSIQNLSGPTGVSSITNDNARPVPWAGGGQVRITGIKVDGAYIWSGRGGVINKNAVYLGPGQLAAPQGNVALWQQPEGVVTFAYCHQ